MLHFAGVVIAASSHAKYGLQPLHTFFGDDLVSTGVFRICFFLASAFTCREVTKKQERRKRLQEKEDNDDRCVSLRELILKAADGREKGLGFFLFL